MAVRIDRGGMGSEITLRTIQSYSLRREVIPLVTNPHPIGLSEPETGPGITAYNLSVLIYGQGNPFGPPVEIYTPILLHYYVEARQGKRFDTSVTDHGIQEVKIVDQVEFDIDSSDGPAVLQVSSDIPGQTMTPRIEDGQEIAETTGREIRQLVLAEPAVGRLLRYQVDTNSHFSNLGFQVYGARARVLPIGVYLDGTVGDFWAPQPISIGV